MTERPIRSDLARVDRLDDSDIDYSDIPPLDDSFLRKPAFPWPHGDETPSAEGEAGLRPDGTNSHPTK